MNEKEEMQINLRTSLFFTLILALLAIISLVIILVYFPPNTWSLPNFNRLVPTATPFLKHENMYPKPDLTPGDIFPDATKERICVTGYTKTVRDVPLSLKKQVYATYNIPFPQPAGSYELDHFIPLALGGSNDAKNLWPESADPRPGYHEKDIVEVYLLDQVCKHGMELKQAQDSVRRDWYEVYEKIPNKTDFQYNVP